MPLAKEAEQAVLSHPCFSDTAHFRCGRIHLPVAPACNIQCAYCDRKYDCPNESRPGVTSVLLSPEQAVERVDMALQKEPRIRVAGIAGPGEPLFNPDTLKTFRLIRQHFPQLSLCLSTNGLLLEENLDEIRDCGITTLTVTVNTRHLETGLQLYEHVQYHGKRLPHEEGILTLLQAQEAGVRLAAQRGIAVKINTVLVPGINHGEIGELAEAVSGWGAIRMNILPLIPQAGLAGNPAPDAQMMKQARIQAAPFMEQFTHCRQCRADACGVPGESDISQQIALCPNP